MDAIVLAGGQSIRLGREKIWEPVGGEPMLGRVARRLAGAFDRVIVVGRTERLPPLPASVAVCADELPGYGPLGGIWSALGRIEGERAFVVACDMPFVRPELAQVLFQAGELAPVVLPLVGGMVEPLHAVYAASCRPLILAALASGQRSLGSFLRKAEVLLVDEESLRALDPELLSFFNLNTEEDVRLARALVRLTERAEAIA